MSPAASRSAKLVAQLATSALVLFLLVRDAELDAVLAALEGALLPWVVASTGLKIAGVTLHEVRLWVSAMPWKRLPLPKVISIGYTAGLVNTVAPARGGDFLAAALLRAEGGLSTTAALAAVGITGFTEMLVFGPFLLVVMALGLTRWEELLGAAQALRTMGWVTGGTLAAVFAAAVLILIARRFGGEEAPRGPGPREWIRQALVDAGEGLSAWGPMTANVVLSMGQVALLVSCYIALFPALGIDLPLPVLAASGVLALGSFAAIALPPSLGAGQAATCVFVLGAFGVGEATALAYAALLWLSSTIAPALLGVIPLWRRLGRLDEIVAGLGDDAPSQ